MLRRLNGVDISTQANLSERLGCVLSCEVVCSINAPPGRSGSPQMVLSEKAGRKMTVREAKEIARDWLTAEGAALSGFCGAFFAGSVNWMAPNEVFPSGSDLDIFIIVDREDIGTLRTRKFLYRGVVLEPAYYPLDEFESPEAVLSDYRVACHLTVPSVISDPRSVLTRIQPVVLDEYGRRKWIRKRCDAARDYVAQCITLGQGAPSPYELWLGWGCFSTFGPRIAALADLRAPTAKRSLVVSKEVFAKYGELPMQERFLRILGVETMPLAEARVCLDECIAVLDRAIEFHRTPCEGDNFVSRASRELLIRGVHEMFEAGYHREVINFIDMVFYISLSVIVTDAPEGVRREADGLFRQYMRHHGISREEEHRTRIELARTGLEELMACAERIIRANPSAWD
jgi:hypothetical protein